MKPRKEFGGALNSGSLFRVVAFLDLFAVARRRGFTAVEFAWLDQPIADVAAG
jgi:hydroxypyruvate isomerase